MAEFQFGGDIVWRPSAEIIAQSRLKRFMDRHGIGSLEELQRRSTEEIEWFWSAVLEELGIEFYVPYERIVDTSRGIAWPRWCCGGVMDIVTNGSKNGAGPPVGDAEDLGGEEEKVAAGVARVEDFIAEVGGYAMPLA